MAVSPVTLFSTCFPGQNEKRVSDQGGRVVGLLTSWTNYVSEFLRLQMSRYPPGERRRPSARRSRPLAPERSSFSPRAVSPGGSHFAVPLAIRHLSCKPRQRHAPNSVLSSSMRSGGASVHPRF